MLRVVNDVKLGKLVLLILCWCQRPQEMVHGTPDGNDTGALPWRNVLQAAGGHLQC